MPHVSSRPLPKEHLGELIERVVSATFLIRNRDELRSFFDDLLTPTEKVMLGKRLLIAILLQRGYSYVQIGGALRVGETTIAAVSEKLQSGGKGFRLALQQLQRKERIEALFDSLMRSLPRIPPKVGPGRWRFLRSQ